MAYSFIGFQTLYIATHWNPIYWNTACLIVDSGSLEDEIDENTKVKGTNYTKIARALGQIISRNIKISTVNINKSEYDFEPDAENNQILFGMKALSGVNEEAIEKIRNNRPYRSFKEFCHKVPLNKTAMISLIKSGAFDELETAWAKELNVEPRILVMVYYLSMVSNFKKKLTLQNVNGLIQKDLIPKEFEENKKVFLFNKKIKNHKLNNMLVLTDEDYDYYHEHFSDDFIQIINGKICILKSDWEKIYKQEMQTIKDWLNGNDELLKQFNFMLFLEYWEKYAKGTISTWEMSSLCFYYHEHELAHVDKGKYGIVSFFDLPVEPEVNYFFKRNCVKIPIYKTYKIIGTVIGKNDTRSTINLLTTEGVVEVKFTKEYYAMFNKQISEKQEDGTKKIKEKGWFTRGTKILCNGYRRDDTFIAKRYSKDKVHQLYKIIDVDDQGNITLTHDRYEVEDEYI